MAAPAGLKERNAIGESKNFSSRWGARILYWVLHTEEGNQSAEGLHQWMINNGVSYHYSARDGVVVDIVDTDYASWSVLDANPLAINWVFAGSRAAFSTQQWMDRAVDIDNAAYMFVQDARKYALQTRTLSHDEVARRQTGATDHYGITVGLRIGDHTDVGRNFPWQHFQERIVAHVVGAVVTPPAPQPPAANAIETLRNSAGFEWLGKKLTDVLEEETPDGKGRYVQYEAGHIYWTAELGAFAIPTAIFETWRDLGWETGALGYPIGFHKVLQDPTGADWGDVQGFQRGAIYRRYGRPGFFVTGLIRSHWNRSGFENGPFGWPTSNEITLEDGSKVQHFEHGDIVWSPEGTIGLKPTDGPDTIVPDKTH